MKAMILAAGRGERLRPLTDTTPKPLLPVAGKPLIEHTILSLKSAGIKEIVINVAYLSKNIIDRLGDGSQLNVQINFSEEGHSALETLGGIVKALPLLGEEPFLVVNGDIATDFPWHSLIDSNRKSLGHLVLVPNPPHHQEGDFALREGLITETGDELFTFSGIGVYDPELFANCSSGKARLAPLLREASKKNQVTGELYKGFWLDIGNPERLSELNDRYKTNR